MVQSEKIDDDIEEMVTQKEINDGDSDTHSEHTTDSIPSLIIRRQEDEDESSCDDSSCDNTIEYDTDNFSDDYDCLLYTSPSPRDTDLSRMPSSA